MPKVIEQVEVKLEWSDLQNLTYHPRRDEYRSEGLHVSHVLREIALRGNMYSNEDREDAMPLRVLLGLAFEESAARLYSGMHWQPGELEYKGLAGSPDGLSFLTGVTACVDEFKYTGKSMRKKGAKPQADGSFLQEDLKDITGEWLWMQQVASYLNLYRMCDPILKRACLGRFHICWKLGTYTYPQSEVYMRYLVEFSEAELRGNWAMMRAFKP